MRYNDVKNKLKKYRDLYYRYLTLKIALQGTKSPTLEELPGQGQKSSIIDKLALLEDVEKDMQEIVDLAEFLNTDEDYRLYLIIRYYYFNLFSIEKIAQLTSYSKPRIYQLINKAIDKIAVKYNRNRGNL